LEGVTLVGATLRRANLTEADLTKAELDGANLEDAALSGANFHEVDLSTVVGLTLSQLRLARNVDPDLLVSDGDRARYGTSADPEPNSTTTDGDSYTG